MGTKGPSGPVDVAMPTTCTLLALSLHKRHWQLCGILEPAALQQHANAVHHKLRSSQQRQWACTKCWLSMAESTTAPPAHIVQSIIALVRQLHKRYTRCPVDRVRRWFSSMGYGCRCCERTENEIRRAACCSVAAQGQSACLLISTHHVQPCCAH